MSASPFKRERGHLLLGNSWRERRRRNGQDWVPGKHTLPLGVCLSPQARHCHSLSLSRIKAEKWVKAKHLPFLLHSVVLYVALSCLPEAQGICRRAHPRHNVRFAILLQMFSPWFTSSLSFPTPSSLNSILGSWSLKEGHGDPPDMEVNQASGVVLWVMEKYTF